MSIRNFNELHARHFPLNFHFLRDALAIIIKLWTEKISWDFNWRLGRCKFLWMKCLKSVGNPRKAFDPFFGCFNLSARWQWKEETIILHYVSLARSTLLVSTGRLKQIFSSSDRRWRRLKSKASESENIAKIAKEEEPAEMKWNFVFSRLWNGFGEIEP